MKQIEENKNDIQTINSPGALRRASNDVPTDPRNKVLREKE